MTSRRIAKSKCPGCGTKLDAATNVVGERAPKPGDVTVCIKCADVLMFDKAMRPVVLTDEQLAALFASQPGLRGGIAMVQQGIADIHRRH